MCTRLRMRGRRLTMPQRETVAGEATARSATSKIMFCEAHERVSKA